MLLVVVEENHDPGLAPSPSKQHCALPWGLTPPRRSGVVQETSVYTHDQRLHSRDDQW